MGKWSGVLDEYNEFKNKKEQWEKIDNLIPDYEAPPEHLVPSPWFPDIWVPDSAGVEPGDCERWPASCEGLSDPTDPMGGMNPMPGISLDTSYSECSLCLTITYNIGPVEFAPYTICYRKPNCQEPERDEEGEDPPPPGWYFDRPLRPEMPPNLNLGNEPVQYRLYPCTLKRKDVSGSYNQETKEVTWGEPTQTDNTPNGWSTGFPWITVELNPGESFYYDTVPINNSHFSNVVSEGEGEETRIRLKLADGRIRSLREYFDNAYRTNGTYDWNRDQLLGTYRDLSFYFVYSWVLTSHTHSTNDEPYNPLEAQTTCTIKIEKVVPPGTPPEEPAPSPPLDNPPNTPDPQPMPTCCDLEPVLRMLKQLTKTLKRCETVLAPKEFFNVNSDGSLGDVIASIPKRLGYVLATGQQPIENYAQMLEAIMRQIDRNTGMPSWEVVIKDSDPTTPGDQKLPIQVHSTSDGLKAILQFLVDQATDINAPSQKALENTLLNQRALLHIGYELATTKKLAIHNNYFLQNIEDHLDYKVKQKEITVPFAINVDIKDTYMSELKNKPIINSVFKVKKSEIVVTENIDKIGLGETLNQISRNAAIAASPHVYKYKPGIVDNLVDAAQMGLELTNTALLLDLKRSLGIMNDDEMKTWGKDAEKAYEESGGNTEMIVPSPPVAGQTIQQQIEQKYYGQPKPIKIVNTTKRSRRRNRRRQ